MFSNFIIIVPPPVSPFLQSWSIVPKNNIDIKGLKKVK